jgi:hypothetical protein
MAPEPGDHIAKQLVACAVAVLVVDGLQIVHIDKRGHEAFARAARTVHFALQLLEPDAASAGAGELVDPRLLAVARGGPTIMRRALAIVLRALARRGRPAAKLLDPQGMPVVESITAVERERLLVGQGGSLVATRRHPIAVLRRFVTLLCGLVAKIGNLQAGPRRPGAHGACVIVGGRVTAVIAIPIGGCLIIV